MTTERNEIIKAIGTICRAAKIIIVVNGDYEEGTVPKLEETAEALVRHFDLGDEIMQKYREEIEQAKTLDSTLGIALMDVDDAQDVIYEMCRSLTDPQEIMTHVFIAREMRFVSDTKLKQRESLW